MRRGRWLALAALPALLLAGDYFYWRLSADRLRTGFDAWTQRAEASGWTVRHGAVITGGWPDAVSLRVSNFTVAATGARGIMAGWTSGAVLLRIRLTRPETLEIIPSGPNTLRFNGGPPVPITADHINLRLPLRLNGVPRGVDLEVIAPSADISGSGVFQAASLSAHADLTANPARDQPAVTFSAGAHLISIPDKSHFALGTMVEDVNLEGTVNNPIPPGADLSARARSWRDGGGSLDLRALAVRWGPAQIDATATLALDDDLQPMGTGTSKIVGFDAALDAMADKSILRKSAVRAAKAMLSLLADSPGEGKPEEVEVPLTLQYRTLSVGQVPLARLPELTWPSP